MSDSVKILLEVVDKATPELQKFQQNLNKTGVSISQFSSLVQTLVAGALVGSFMALVRNSLAAADAMGDMADRAGVSVQSFSALAYVAKFADLTAEQLEGSLVKLSRTIAESVDPTSKSAIAFEYLGVSVKNADGSLRKADEVLLDLAAAISKMPDGVNKVDTAIQLFGKSGAALVPLLNMGKEEIIALTEEATRLGVVVSEDVRQQAAGFNDAMDRMGAAAEGASLTVATEMLPTLNALTNEIFKSVQTEGAVKQWAEAIGFAFKWVTRIVGGFITAVELSATAVGRAMKYVAILTSEGLGAANKYWESSSKLLDDIIQRGADFQNAIDAGAKGTVSERAALNQKLKSLQEEIKKRQEEQKAAEQAAEARDRLFMQTMRQLEEEKAGVNDMTALQKIQYQTTEGSLKTLLPEQKRQLEILAKKVDLERTSTLANQENFKATIAGTEAIRLMKSSVIDAWDSGNRLMLLGTRVHEAMNQFVEPVIKVREEIEQLNTELAVAKIAGNGKQAEQIGIMLDAKKKQLEVMKAAIDSGEALDTARLIARTRVETEAWNSLVQKTRDGWSDLVTQTELVQKWLAAGKISQDEFNAAIRQIDESKFNLIKQSLSDIDKKATEFASTLQTTFGDVFYNIMQGNFKDIGTMFKQMLDKMVAEALAARLAYALFGDFSRTGRVSGSGGGLLTSLAGAMFGFRENGGPVSAGQPYIVGEKRPELFIPNRSGTILPDTSALAMAGGNSVQLSITAMDSQDVIRALDKIKRPLADMVNSTNRSYNMK